MESNLVTDESTTVNNEDSSLNKDQKDISMMSRKSNKIDIEKDIIQGKDQINIKNSKYNPLILGRVICLFYCRNQPLIVIGPHCIFIL